MPQRAYNVWVTGRVQRAGYRRLILETAQELEVSGYVQNKKDGSVTIFAQGEETPLNQFLERIKTPPIPVIIKSFEAKIAKLEPKARYFEIKFGSIAEELQEGLGSMEREFRDYREEFRDYRKEFQGFSMRTNQNFQMLDEYGEVSARLAQLLETFQKESLETRKELKRAVDNLAELVRQFVEEQGSHKSY